MFGSGKTELSINTAITLRKSSSKVALIDIDIISPYFRSRDEKLFLENMNIKVITAPERYMHADLPIIPPEVGGYISNKEFLTVIDAGGNEDGAIVLGSLNHFLENVDKKILFVINVFRPFSSTEEEIVRNIDKISRAARSKIDYLVNNSNIGPETTTDDIKTGEEIVLKVSKMTGIPAVFTSIDENIDYKGKLPIFRMKRFMKNSW
ncbi:MAG: cobalamin biosynthesis protein CobQ [Athalassotoga sp.]